MIKIKHARTADCVVAGFRWHKSGTRRGRLAAARPVRRAGRAASRRRHLVVHDGDAQAAGDASSRRCASDALEEHPWREWADAAAATTTRMPGGQSRWSAGKDLSWEPLRIERVCEVKYDHMQGDRFRHAAMFLRWRPDKPPSDCRYDQLEVTTPYELEKVFGAAQSAALTRFQSSGVIVGIERLLRRPQRLGHVLQVDADARPGAMNRPRIASTSTSAGCEMRGRLGMARLPALESGERVLLLRARGRSRSADASASRRRDGCTRGGSPGCFL